jgi:CBS domain-containing protein
MRSTPARIVLKERPSLVSDERAEASLSHAILLALIVGAVIIGSSFVGSTTQRTLEQLAVNRTTAPAAAPVTTNNPPKDAAPGRGFAPIRDVRLWIQCSAIVVGFVVYYLLARRAARIEQDACDDIDVRVATQDEVEAKLYAKRQEILLALSKSPEALASGQVSIRHLMTTRLITIEPRATLEEARQMMADHNLRHLLVCQHDKLLGVISDRDLAKPGRSVGEIMTGKPVTVEPETRINPAITMMVQKRISSLPVTQGDRLVGLFTTTDLIMTLQCAFQLLQTNSDRLSATIDRAPPAVRDAKRDVAAASTA